MRVLIVGGGGREHALAWKAAQSDAVERVYVAPGNAGTALEPKVTNVDLAVNDFTGLKNFAADNGINLTIIGPEAPLVDGIRDVFDDHGLACFGPSRLAARLEGSKSFSKEFMARHGIPTAAFETFDDLDAAEAWINDHGAPVVVKADGLAAGKGVVVAQTTEQALDAVRDMQSGNRFGDSGRRVVLEEFMTGEEATFICLCDGETVLPLATSQDHKPRDEGDRGPNTGGMGAYSPAPVITAEVHRRVMDEIIHPTLKGMVQEGAPYQGFLYAGLMIAEDGSPRVVEFNCRFGDPEAQPVLSRLRSDLAEICLATVQGNLSSVQLDWRDEHALGVVLAAGGYPQSYATGAAIEGLDHHVESLDRHGEGTKVFHAGTKADGDTVRTAGGRVLCVVGLGADLRAAFDAAYARIEGISWPQMYYRRDIGYRVLK